MPNQTDGVAMGSSLGPAVANIFAGYYEEKLFSQMQKPPTYFRYYNFGREVTFGIQVAIIATSNTRLNIIIQYI